MIECCRPQRTRRNRILYVYRLFSLRPPRLALFRKLSIYKKKEETCRPHSAARTNPPLSVDHQSMAHRVSTLATHTSHARITYAHTCAPLPLAKATCSCLLLFRRVGLNGLREIELAKALRPKAAHLLAVDANLRRCKQRVEPRRRHGNLDKKMRTRAKRDMISTRQHRRTTAGQATAQRRGRQ